MNLPNGKSPDAMRTIGEASAELNIKSHILRYWEAQFDALQPLKRAGGRRYYRPEDMAMLREIDRLVNRERYTIKGAQKYLRQKNAAENQSAASHSGDRPALSGEALPSNALSGDALSRLKSIRDSLAGALAKA